MSFSRSSYFTSIYSFTLETDIKAQCYVGFVMGKAKPSPHPERTTSGLELLCCSISHWTSWTFHIRNGHGQDTVILVHQFKTFPTWKLFIGVIFAKHTKLVPFTHSYDSNLKGWHYWQNVRSAVYSLSNLKISSAVQQWNLYPRDCIAMENTHPWRLCHENA